MSDFTIIHFMQKSCGIFAAFRTFQRTKQTDSILQEPTSINKNNNLEYYLQTLFQFIYLDQFNDARQWIFLSHNILLLLKINLAVENRKLSTVRKSTLTLGTEYGSFGKWHDQSHSKKYHLNLPNCVRFLVKLV